MNKYFQKKFFLRGISESTSDKIHLRVKVQ